MQSVRCQFCIRTHMFRNTYQKGLLSIFYSIGSSPLAIWKSTVENGHVKRLTDDDLKSVALEITGVNVATTYITTPIGPRASLAIKLPFLVLIVKNMEKLFSFEVQILDNTNLLRRFRVSNYQSTTSVKPFCAMMPLGLAGGWNKIQLNLADFTRRAYATDYVETVRVQIHANTRIRRIFFSDRLYGEDELPPAFCLNQTQKKVKAKVTGKTKEKLPTTPTDSPRKEKGACCTAPCALIID